MPQMLPFYFVNQVTFVILLLMILLYVFSYYILPGIVSWFNSRFFSEDI